MNYDSEWAKNLPSGENSSGNKCKHQELDESEDDKAPKAKVSEDFTSLDYTLTKDYVFYRQGNHKWVINSDNDANKLMPKLQGVENGGRKQILQHHYQKPTGGDDDEDSGSPIDNMDEKKNTTSANSWVSDLHMFCYIC